jgi:hypothetical protein
MAPWHCHETMHVYWLLSSNTTTYIIIMSYILMDTNIYINCYYFYFVFFLSGQDKTLREKYCTIANLQY